MNVQFKSNFRSLRRAFTKTDKKRLGYTWVPASADVDHDGEDVHDTLQRITVMANAGILRPRLGQVVPFEKAVDALPHPIQLGEPTPDVVVVRVIG
jgi:NADPH:quinone reductase-like Zn-dependent oxidoreductase